jgi:hypothetical protein
MSAISEQLRIKWTRWQKAQEYERGFWQRLGQKIETGVTGQLDWCRWRAARLEELLATVPTPASPARRVLEIGSGPIGIINFLDWPERYAIDPLESFYARQPSLIRRAILVRRTVRRPESSCRWEDASCGLVIIDNVIDHTYAPEGSFAKLPACWNHRGGCTVGQRPHRLGCCPPQPSGRSSHRQGHRLIHVAQLANARPRGFSIQLEQIGGYLDARDTDR